MAEDHETVLVHGRVFQRISIDERIYLAPVAADESEEDRLTAQHDLITMLFGGALWSPRIPVYYPRKILDCGYGGGDWCVACAEEYEDCEVTGVDIFPLVLPDQEDNLELGCHDLNKRLIDPNIFQSRAYDLIHSRFIHQGMRTSRWAPYIENLKKLLRPGGWVQLMEYYPMVQSNSGLLTNQSAVRRWWAQYDACMTRLHRDPRICNRFGELLTQAGYRDVAVDREVLPIGGWDPDPRRAALGVQSQSVIGDMLEGLGLWPFTTNGLGWPSYTIAQYEHLMEEIRAELANRDLKLYIVIYIARGRRSTRA